MRRPLGSKIPASRTVTDRPLMQQEEEGGMKKQIKNGHKSALTLTLWAQDGRGQNT